MAEEIVNASGGGKILKYNPLTGQWETRPNVQDGNSLVLISDWYKESDIDDSGFSEAAADSIFAGLMQLNKQEQNKIFSSPLHLIGHSLGTIVNSEILQRLGTYRPDIRNIHVTNLDIHDFSQPNLGRLGFSWDDFHEPEVKVWDNVGFAENYYQILAENNLFYFASMTPNGRSLQRPLYFPSEQNYYPNVDLEVFLNQKVGFQEDDAGNLNPTFTSAGVGPHSRVWRWYAGTINLSLTKFETGKEPIFRKSGDERKFNYFGGDELYDATGQPHPWYVPQENNLYQPEGFAANPNDAPWEGIGVGWYYSVLGGGEQARPQRRGQRFPITTDNTHYLEKGVTPEQSVVKINDKYAAVPSIFNGNFEAGTIRRKNDLYLALEKFLDGHFMEVLYLA